MTATTITDHDREYQHKALELLRAHFSQGPGLNPRDYGDRASYASDYHDIRRALQHARTLYAYMLGQEYTAEEVRYAFRRPFSGRLRLTEDADGLPVRLDYDTGQYFPTKYRRAACAVLACLVWDRLRDQAAAEFPDAIGINARRLAKKIFGHAIASRWLD